MKEQHFVHVLEQYPELIEELKTPEHKVKDKKTMFNEFGAIKDEDVGKYKYENKQDAEKSLWSCKLCKSKNRKEKSVYQDENGYWYVTSQKHKNDRKKKHKMKRTTNTFTICHVNVSKKKLIIRTNML